MKILFDQGTPVPLRSFLSDHEITTAFEMGWQTLENGELLAAAEGENFELVITTDQNLRYQQNLKQRKIAIIVLLSTSWPRIRKHTSAISTSIGKCHAGEYFEIPIP
jgi:predicted nuclease of predicted toxin-antitoxin system